MTETKSNLFEKIFLKSWRPYAWIIIIGFLIFFQTLSFDFVLFDDDLLITANQKFISDFSNFFQAFKEDVFFSPFDIYYRPMLTISFMIDAQFGGAQPFVYHLTNTLLHLACAIFLFVLLNKLKINRDLAFLFTLIFAIHPIVTQAVGWVPGRNDSLLAFFLLPAFIFFLKFLDKNKWLYLLLHLIFMLLAVFTKETAILFMPLVILYLLIINKEKFFSKNQWLLATSWLPILLSWFFLRRATFEHSIVMNFGEMITSLITKIPSLIQYIGKIFFPFNLSVFPVMADTTYIYGTIALILLITLLLFSKNKRLNYVFFGLAWFILLILPTLVVSKSVAVPTFLEHRVYAPMIGLIIILLEIDLVKKVYSQKKILYPLFFIIFLTFSFINIAHSKKFSESNIFWESAVKSSPHSGFVQREVGYIYLLSNRVDEAREKFLISLELNPREQLSHYYLGNIHLANNELEKAKEEYEKELITDPIFDNALYNLGLVYSKQGDINNAKFYWEKTLESNSEHSEALNSLGLVYINEKDYAKAAAVLNKAIEYDPEFDGAWQNLGLLYFQMKDFNQAESAWLKAVEINPQLIKVHENLAILYIQQNNIEQAVNHVQEIINQGKEVQEQLLQALKPYLNETP